MVPFPVFLEPGEEPLAQPNEVEEPDALFRLDTPDTTQATPHL
ncbi:hypothetical protein ACFQVD_26885 [Streptosporangium amethystogenes subsp. fukuiense]|uniref:Uncharacterized protein n=1 Tax=Streptosporangium amethystogenes subsp. fukuiense TaxID=698418 RepID=A0ABW2T4X0_9ACTN